MLQAGRGAATFVVLFYATVLVHIDVLEQASVRGRFLFGTGVNFFFVLSDFIIVPAQYADGDHPPRLKRYLWKRFTQIYSSHHECSADQATAVTRFT